ncbi:[protein-PII] uridylyltransferase [Streptomyces antimicrobicus]|uniref:Bifunctional uridylyltransferase/uridylyl-removing enzyme n=1 Tax=Streptomyces antimicrobicus TaxID=2883108 RepID=A0ABS8BC65_9ACTN|nr:[protein-PII] uridylyltransferase [Streptomyces antimicrobicus]MCB5182123.1 [protein-PII] uridylyltransferase [Streptomyces antimicrobicus]
MTSVEHTRPGPSDRTDPADPGTGGYAAARLRLLQQEPRSGPDRRSGLARLTDDWLTALFAAAAAQAGVRGAALVAVGGYGRAELSPRSDLDLLLLHDGKADPKALAALADRLWYPVWDLGLSLDHSVRTPAEARRTAAEDLKVHLGLLDARPVAGDLGLLAGLRTSVLADWRNQAAARLPELHAMCRERAERCGELRFLLEPDLKEARGGLRDVTALRAVAASWVADAPRAGLDRARRRLLDARDALHLVTGRASDRLSLQEHDAVAAQLGLDGADALLREVYEAAGVVAYAGDVTWREVGRVLRARAARPRLRGLLGGRGAPAVERAPLAEGVVEQDGEAVLALAARPDRDPALPLRLAAAAAQAGLPVSPHAVRRLAAQGRGLPVPWPAEAREQLLTLLGAGEPTVDVWEALEAEGLISRLLPEWERVRCRPQRNPVHTWTVDRHLVETAVRASALTRRVSRPDLLLMAALLHDIGKGLPGDHAEAGEGVARGIAVRLGFEAADVAVLATLVRHHLLLIETATRRDLDDPATVRAVADAVGSPVTLELLHALTEADARATGPAAWSAWRGSLVADLVARVAAVLGGAAVASAAPPGPGTEEERMAVEALRTGEPVLGLHARHEEDAVGVELVVAVPDQPGVLPAAAGVLALHRLTVRAADLRSLELPDRLGEVLVLRWRVAAAYGSLPQAARLRADLVRALDGSLDVPAKLADREAAYPRRRGVVPPPPRVTVVPDVSSLATVLEVRAPDAVGLLHRIGRALEDAGVRVRSAHVSTLGANAVDSLYVTTVEGKPLAPHEATGLAAAVESALR